MLRCCVAATGKGDPLAHPRLTVLGTFAKIERDTPDGVRVGRRFLSRHPKSKLYAGFGDFAFWRLTIVSAHLNGGFARAADLMAADIVTERDGAEEIVEIEEGAIAHMNADHPELGTPVRDQALGRARRRMGGYRRRSGRS